MATLDEIAKAEDEVASALQELQEFKRDERNWSYRQEKSDQDPRFTRKVADLAPSYFPQLEMRQRSVEVAEEKLRQAKLAWLRGIV